MEFDEVVKIRRSIRRYKKEALSSELIEQCIQAACHAPSAHNAQPWKFAVITDRSKIEALSKTQKWSAFLVNAPAVIVVLGDEKLSRHWIEDCSAATMLLLLKAAELGLGACWNAVFMPETKAYEEYVKNILGIKEKSLRVLCNIGIGWPDERPAPKRIKSFDEAVFKCSR